MQVQRRTQLAWLLFLSTFGCLAGGLVVTLFVTRPLTSDVLVTAPSTAPSGCCSPPWGWS